MSEPLDVIVYESSGATTTSTTTHKNPLNNANILLFRLFRPCCRGAAIPIHQHAPSSKKMLHNTTPLRYNHDITGDMMICNAGKQSHNHLGVVVVRAQGHPDPPCIYPLVSARESHRHQQFLHRIFYFRHTARTVGTSPRDHIHM